MKENIYLIGFMGTGKTTISNALSIKLGIPEVDMDAYIVEHENKSINKIFELVGEEGFRKIETACLCEIQKNGGKIISCGGGAVLKDENVSYMKKSGIIVLLTALPETIYNRVKDSKERPILNDNMSISFIENLMNKRKARYHEVADLEIQTDHRTIEEIVNQIIEDTDILAKK